MANFSSLGHFDLAGFTQLQSLDLRNLELVLGLSTPDSLSHLAILDERVPDRRIHLDMIHSNISAQNLRTLELRGRSTLLWILYITQRAPSVFKLSALSLQDFIYTSQMRGMAIDSLDLAYFTSLGFEDALGHVETLALRDENLKDHYWDTINKIFPAVNDLLLEAPFLTEAFLTDYVNARGSGLRRIVFRDCKKISDAASAWGRSRGVEVNISRGAWKDESLSAQRVRYG